MQAPCLIKKKKTGAMAIVATNEKTNKVQERRIIITTAQPFVVVLKHG